jgi:hypothetical protein
MRRLPPATLPLWGALLAACGEPAYFPTGLPPFDSASFADDGGGGDGAEPTCSTDGPYVERSLHVENQSTLTVQVYWVDSACTENDYGPLPAGTAYDQLTSVGHVWNYRDASNGALLESYAVTEAEGQTVVIQ